MLEPLWAEKPPPHRTPPMGEEHLHFCGWETTGMPGSLRTWSTRL